MFVLCLFCGRILLFESVIIPSVSRWIDGRLLYGWMGNWLVVVGSVTGGLVSR